jgi:carbonic anhydrase
MADRSRRYVSAVVALAVLAAMEFPPVQCENFSYSGSMGPNKWGSLNPTYSNCSHAPDQSPIDIWKNQTVFEPKLTPLKRDYRPTKATLINHGVAVGVSFDGNVGDLTVDGKVYSLKQFHWHTPSEHYIDGIQYPAELHLLHIAKDGSIAVVAVLYHYGKEDPILSKMKKQLKELARDDEDSQISLGVFNPKHLKRRTRKYYKYIGSTTTPPCMGRVEWNVLAKVRSISKEQVESLRAPLKGDDKDNDRPLQQLQGRKVQLYDELHKHNHG